MNQYFHAVGLHSVCEVITRSCYHCARNILLRNPDTTGLEHVQRGTKPMDLLYMDVLQFSAPHSRNNKKYVGVLQIVCSYSCFLFSELITDSSSNTVIRVLRNLHQHFNLRKSTIITDNARSFRSQALHEYANQIGLQIKHTLPYSSQGNLCETFNPAEY